MKVKEILGRWLSWTYFMRCANSALSRRVGAFHSVFEDDVLFLFTWSYSICINYEN